MSAFGWLVKFGEAKAAGSEDGMRTALMLHDPNTADKIDLDDLKQSVHDMGVEVAEAETREETDHHAMDDLQGKLNQTKQAAAMLGDQLKAATAANNITAVADLTTKLTRLIATIKDIGGPLPSAGTQSGKLFDAVVRHHKSEERLHQRQELHAGLTANLTAHTSQHTELQQQLADAKLDEQQAQRDRQDAERIAGIASRVATGNVAATAMQQAIENTRKRTRAAQLDAEALKSATGAASGIDDLVQQTLAGATVATDPLAELATMTGKAT
jgi:hypothetical protein